MSQLKIMRSDDEIQQCFPVIAALRPHLAEQEFMSQFKRQQVAGYRLLALLEHRDVIALAGFRVTENFAMGKFVYVDDLITLEKCRSQGGGGLLLSWLLDFAREQRCRQLHLDSSVHRHAAHRFYLKHRMDITGYHFAISIA